MTPDLYVYAVPGRDDGLTIAVHATATPREILALFRNPTGAQVYLDGMRATGTTVAILPSAEWLVS